MALVEDGGFEKGSDIPDIAGKIGHLTPSLLRQSSISFYFLFFKKGTRDF